MDKLTALQGFRSLPETHKAPWAGSRLVSLASVALQAAQAVQGSAF